jgi:hypothetical protein
MLITFQRSPLLHSFSPPPIAQALKAYSHSFFFAERTMNRDTTQADLERGAIPRFIQSSYSSPQITVTDVSDFIFTTVPSLSATARLCRSTSSIAASFPVSPQVSDSATAIEEKLSLGEQRFQTVDLPVMPNHHIRKTMGLTSARLRPPTWK